MGVSFVHGHEIAIGEFEQTARNLHGNANANVTFDYHSRPKIMFTFAFPGLRTVCSNSLLFQWDLDA